MPETRGLIMLTYTDDALACAAELGRDTFPDLDSRSAEDRCVIASHTLSGAFEALGAQPHGEPWYVEAEHLNGFCLTLPSHLDGAAHELFEQLAKYGFTIQGSLLTATYYSWWRFDPISGHSAGRIDDLQAWLLNLEAPSVRDGLHALLEDLHPSDLGVTDSRSVYTRLGLAYLGEHEHHDKHHDAYRDLAFLAVTEVTFPNTLPMSCFHRGLDSVITEDVFQ